MVAGQPARDIRVLVVDDSVVMRRIVVRALERFPGIAVAGSASNGRLALAKLAAVQPDVVVLDVEMPEMDGFATLTEIRRLAPELPVVLFSHVDERVAQQTLAAMSLGATDFVVKPNEGSLEAAELHVSERLAPLLLELATPHLRSVPTLDRAPSRTTGRVAVVVMAVSTGGPDALDQVIRGLPPDLPVPVLIVQHMPPVFTRLLAERLDRACRIAVCEAEDSQLVEPGHVYVAPGGRHLTVVAGGPVRVALGDGPQENYCRPAADVLFRTACEAYSGEVLGVVLTGMGKDGLQGCTALREAGGQVVVQDPATAVIASMPLAVVAAGLADAVVPLEKLSAEIVRRVALGH